MSNSRDQYATEGSQKGSGHAPGVKVGNDAFPEFHATTLPAGSAPADRTFAPNVTAQTDVPGASHPQTGEETYVSAADTIGGATSADVHAGYGKPIQGESSSEIHSKRQGSKTGNVGANQTDAFEERRLNDDHVRGGKEMAGDEEVRADIVGAEEKLPVSAEGLAAEFD